MKENDFYMNKKKKLSVSKAFHMKIFHGHFLLILLLLLLSFILFSHDKKKS